MDVPRNWRLKHQRYRMKGTRCLQCEELSFPPALICSKCKSRELTEFFFSGKGKIYSFSTVYQAPIQFQKYVPYLVALIDLGEGIRITAQLTDINPADVEIGMDVEMVVRKICEEGDKGVVVYGYKFRPLIRIE